MKTSTKVVRSFEDAAETNLFELKAFRQHLLDGRQDDGGELVRLVNVAILEFRTREKVREATNRWNHGHPHGITA